MAAGQSNRHGKGIMIEIDDDDDWMSSMWDKLSSLKPFKNNFLCRVPQPIREYNHAAYSPTVVSFGPLHRQKHNLLVTVDYKWHYLKAILNESEPQNDLEMYIKELMAVETVARDYYSEENIDMDSHEFVEMMPLDGCFIIQLFIQDVATSVDNDLIESIGVMSPLVFRDMLLLENQIPFLVLESIWKFVRKPNDVSLMQRALNFFCRGLPVEFNFVLKDESKTPLHVLHLVHSSLVSDLLLQVQPEIPSQESVQFCSSSVPPPPQESPQESSQLPLLPQQPEPHSESHEPHPELRNMLLPPQPFIPYVSELQEFGISFKRKRVGSLLHVSFEKGVLEMPRLFISDHSESLFRNLIAFEQLFPDFACIHFTSYFWFISSLLNTERDVQILSKSDIIENWMGNDKEVVRLFNNICNEVYWDIRGSYLAPVYEEIVRHTEKKWPKWRAKFMRPWAIVYIIVATVLLIFGILQTFFDIFAHFKPPKSQFY